MNKIPIDILLIEDTASDSEIVQRLLHGSSILQSSVCWVQSMAAAAEAMRENSFDLVLADMGLPDCSGLETIIELKELTRGRLPIITLTSQDEDGLGLAAIQSGAHDFVPKNLLNEPTISRAIVHTIERFQMAKEIKDTNQSLKNKNERLAQMYNMSQQFVDNVSHEFRTPLTVIREFAAIVRDGIDGPVTEKQTTRLSTLINRTDDLANMVDDLLDTSRLEAGLLKTCREEHVLSEIVGKVERMLRTRAATKKISLVACDVPTGMTVFCDEEKLRRVLINLVVNAIKFTPIEGKVEISAMMADADRVRITVSDNGAGIAADELDRIFQRFQQVEAHHRMASCKGFGLGLSIARALASLNLGSLEVTSVEGQGSQFSVLVPVAKPDSILNCYFDQRMTALEENGMISLLEAFPGEMAPEDRDEVLDTLDEFLRTSVKSFDLVLKPQEDRWLVYTCTSNASLPAFKNRILKEWEQLRRNHYSGSLPCLSFEDKLTVDVSEGREALMNFARPPETTVDPPADQRRLTKILVVDDEVEVVNAIETRLVASGFDVATARDGVAGLRAVKQLKPDAILLDVRMPLLDGMAVLTELKSDPETALTPVIVLSASMHDKQNALERGASFFIPKPYQSESLMAALHAVVEKREPSLAGELL